MWKFPYRQLISGKSNKEKKQDSLQVDKVTVVNEKKKRKIIIITSWIQWNSIAENRPNIYLNNVSGILYTKIFLDDFGTTTSCAMNSKII